MGFATIRDEIVTLLKATTDIGEVGDHTDHTTTWEEHFNRHKKDGRLNFWEVTRIAASQDIRAVQNSSSTEPFFFDRHQVLITGRLALKDKGESEKDFQDLVDNVVAKFRVTNTLNGKVILPRQAQVREIGHRDFGGVLVHQAELTFEAVEPVGG